MRLEMTLEKAARSTERDISSSALGTTCVTSDLPSASIMASMGPITVVLPAPMIIWCTVLCPRLAEAMKSLISSI